MSDISKINVGGTDYNIKSLPIIKNNVNTTTGINLEDNTIHRFVNTLNSLSLTIPTEIDNYFQSELVFKSGATASSLTYNIIIKWSGDDVLNNVFVPQANKTYNILFWYDGFNMNAVVRGV